MLFRSSGHGLTAAESNASDAVVSSDYATAQDLKVGSAITVAGKTFSVVGINQNFSADQAELTRILLAQCDRVATRLRREQLSARGVTLKLRLADFSLRTRSRSGLRATQLAPRLFAAARPLLDAQPDGIAYRLLGVAATELGSAEGADADDMFAHESGREKFREAAIAALRDRFGPTAVQRGLTFRPGPGNK